MKDLISREALLENAQRMTEYDEAGWGVPVRVVKVEHIETAPTIDAVPVERYNEIREDFIDYVCSGVPNPAPHCGNATEKCVDARGWCVNSECEGFTPRGERKE